MRELKTTELDFVSGGMMVCTPEDLENTIYGISNPSSFGRDVINIYEGLIEATSYIIERVANSFR